MTEPPTPPSQRALELEGRLLQPLEGFSGATPMESYKRDAAVHFSREQLVDELVRFPYVAVERDPFDDFSAAPPGAWSELGDAEERGLIDEEIYEEVFSRRHTAPHGPEEPE